MGFIINNLALKQPLYFCNKITCIYYNCEGYVDLNIFSTSFPYPMLTTNTSHIEQISDSTSPTTPPSTKKYHFLQQKKMY